MFDSLTGLVVAFILLATVTAMMEKATWTSGTTEHDDWCPICGETLSECECTDQDAHEAYGDYDAGVIGE